VRRLGSAFGALSLALFVSACVRGSWSRVDVGRSVPEEFYADSAATSTDLTQCLAQLGAPLYVWELADDEYGLAYGWDHASGWGLNVSIPIVRGISASVDYESLAQKLHGVVLIFDRQDRLLRQHTGFLGELIEDDPRRRPAFVDTPSDQKAQPE
jgi:hypothetical protein